MAMNRKTESQKTATKLVNAVMTRCVQCHLLFENPTEEN